MKFAKNPVYPSCSLKVSPAFKARQWGLSLLEVMVALFVLVTVATVGVMAFGSLSTASKSSKLEADTSALNRAVTMYLASGGDLSSAQSASAVLEKLKTTTSAAQIKTQINPLTRSMIDPRLVAVLQTSEEASSSKLRTYWNTGTQRFEAKTSGGAGGVKAFELDPVAAQQAAQVESRSSGSMEFASQSGWIWDFKNSWDSGVDPDNVPTQIIVTTVPLPTPVPAGQPPTQLTPPVFSIPGGPYPATDFDLPLTLSNPNPDGSSHLRYSIHGDSWSTYSGPIFVPPGSLVRAKAISEVPGTWRNSTTHEEEYTATLINLAAPSISLSDVAFTDTVSTITITMTDNNAAGLADIYYDIVPNNDTYQPVQLWTEYSGSFSATVADYPHGFDVIAYARAVDPDSYEHSDDAEASTTATFFDTPLSGDVLFVIDASSSMNNSFGSGSRFEAAIAETVAAIWSLDPSQRFSVAMFDAGVHWTDGSNELKEASQANKTTMANLIQSVDNDSGTNYKAGLGLALQFDRKPGTLIFLTDGRPNNTPYDAELAALVSEGIKADIFGIELSASALATVLEISDATGGSVTLVTEDNGLLNGISDAAAAAASLNFDDPADLNGNDNDNNNGKD